MSVIIDMALKSLGLAKEQLTHREIETIESELAVSGDSRTLKTVVSGLSSHDICKYSKPNLNGFKYDYLVVGAGLFGATFANIAHSLGKRVLVVERRPFIGGNAHSRKVEGIEVHSFGPHIFHTNSDRVWRFVNRFASFNGFVNHPLAYYRGSLYSLPMNMHTFHKLWGVVTPEEARRRVIRMRGDDSIRNGKNAEETAKILFGRRIYKTLIKGYTEKQWGRKCSELPSDIIERLPMRYTYDGNYFNARYQGIPFKGYTAMIEKMLRGIPVRLNVDYIKQKDELDDLAEKIVYTGAIDELFGYCLGPLEYRSIRFVESTVDTPNYQGNAVINYTDKKIPYTRIIEYKHFAYDDPEVQAKNNTVIMKEFPSEWTVGKEPYYPIADDNNLRLYVKYRALADNLEKKYIFGGRLAEYRYYNMDEVIERALEAADIEMDN